MPTAIPTSRPGHKVARRGHNGVEILPLCLGLTPRKAGNKVILELVYTGGTYHGDPP